MSCPKQGSAKSETCRTKIFSSVNFWSRLWFKIKLSFFSRLDVHFDDTLDVDGSYGWNLKICFFFSKLVDWRLWATISRKIFYADEDFFLKLGCKRQVLSELGIKTTLIFSLSFDTVFNFCVPLSIRWSNQHWVEKPHHFVVVQERTFWREKNSFNFLARKMIVSFSTNFFWGTSKDKIDDQYKFILKRMKVSYDHYETLLHVFLL